MKTLKDTINSCNLSKDDKQKLLDEIWFLLYLKHGGLGGILDVNYVFIDKDSFRKCLCNKNSIYHEEVLAEKAQGRDFIFKKGLDNKLAEDIVNSKEVSDKLWNNAKDNWDYSMLYLMP